MVTESQTGAASRDAQGRGQGETHSPGTSACCPAAGGCAGERGGPAGARNRRAARAWLLLTGAGLLGGVLLRADILLMRWRYALVGQDGPDGLLKQYVEGLRHFGQAPAITVALLIAAMIDRRRRAIIATVLLAQLAASLAYNPLKAVVGRYRPFAAIEAVGPLEGMRPADTWLGWRPGNRENRTQSFPSGHSAAAFAFAGILAFFYPRLRGLFWVLAAGCALSRFIDGVHWLSDCWFGAAIGLLSAWMVLSVGRRSGPLDGPVEPVAADGTLRGRGSPRGYNAS